MTKAYQNITLEQVNINSPTFRANPFPTFKRWRHNRPVVPVKAFGQRAWLVTRYDDVLVTLTDERFVKNRRNASGANKKPREMWLPGFVKPLERNMLDSDDPDHGSLRYERASGIYTTVNCPNANSYSLLGTRTNR
jgi:cytochrome P450